MLNFYPWGLSINIVTPLDINRTKVSFIQFMLMKPNMILEQVE